MTDNQNWERKIALLQLWDIDLSKLVKIIEKYYEKFYDSSPEIQTDRTCTNLEQVWLLLEGNKKLQIAKIQIFVNNLMPNSYNICLYSYLRQHDFLIFQLTKILEFYFSEYGYFLRVLGELDLIFDEKWISMMIPRWNNEYENSQQRANTLVEYSKKISKESLKYFHPGQKGMGLFTQSSIIPLIGTSTREINVDNYYRFGLRYVFDEDEIWKLHVVVGDEVRNSDFHDKWVEIAEERDRLIRLRGIEPKSFLAALSSEFHMEKPCYKMRVLKRIINFDAYVYLLLQEKGSSDDYKGLGKILFSNLLHYFHFRSEEIEELTKEGLGKIKNNTFAWELGLSLGPITENKIRYFLKQNNATNYPPQKTNLFNIWSLLNSNGVIAHKNNCSVWEMALSCLRLKNASDYQIILGVLDQRRKSLISGG